MVFDYYPLAFVEWSCNKYRNYVLLIESNDIKDLETFRILDSPLNRIKSKKIKTAKNLWNLFESKILSCMLYVYLIDFSYNIS